MWRDSDYKIDRIAGICSKNEIEEKQHFPVICPICGKKEGHLYAHRHKLGEDAGGRWTWCSACHNYSHVLAKLPKWWKNPDFIEFGKLQHSPDYLEENKDYIDEWINSLILANFPNEK